jgi:hypothetical protein
MLPLALGWAHRGPDAVTQIHTSTLLLVANPDAAAGSCAPPPTTATVSALPSADAASSVTSSVEGLRVDRLKKENEKDEESERSTVGENRRAIGLTPHVRYWRKFNIGIGCKGEA